MKIRTEEIGYLYKVVGGYYHRDDVEPLVEIDGDELKLTLRVKPFGGGAILKFISYQEER